MKSSLHNSTKELHRCAFFPSESTCSVTSKCTAAVFVSSTNKKSYEYLFNLWWITPRCGFSFIFSSDIFLSKMNTICCKHMLCFDPFHVLLLHYTFVCVFSLNWKYVSALPFVIQTNNQTADRKTLAWIWSKLSKNEKEKTEKKMLNGCKYKTEVFFFINSLYRNWGKAAPLIRSLWLF